VNIVVGEKYLPMKPVIVLSLPDVVSLLMPKSAILADFVVV